MRSHAIEYRKYQIDIAQKCLLKNSLVVIPTGLGKTIIAVLVSAHTLEAFPSNSKIVVLAPTRPLIHQHYQSFKKLLDLPEERFTLLTGKVAPQKRAELFEKSQIIFYTPQTLRNDLVQKRYTLEEVCLIVFDEAHHSSGDYAYTTIAEEYADQNHDGNVLALTASPGASQTKIDELCKSLHIPSENIHTRTRKDKDVKSYLQPLDLYKIGVDLNELMEDAYVVIQQFLEERLRYLRHLGFLDYNGNKKLTESIYRKHLLKLNTELVSKLQSNGDKTGVYTALSVNAQALILYHMIDLIEQQGLDVLFKYIKKMKKDAKKRNSSKALKILASEYRLHQVYVELLKYHDLEPEKLVHPKYFMLEKILKEQFRSVPDSRVLVFVKLRDSVKNITQKLKKKQYIKASRFVGQTTKSKDDKGFSQKEQLGIIEQFKQGKYNTLVSTNVGEEGLDIAECDLVIFYDVVASEIRFIQRKGRTARQRKGSVMILYTRGTHDEVYLNIVMRKLKRMNLNLRTPERKFSFSSFSPNPLVLKERSQSKTDKISASQKQGQLNLSSYMQEPSDVSETTFKKEEHYGIVLNSRVSNKYGLRKRLQEENISFTIAQIEPDLIIFNHVIIQLYTVSNFSVKFQHELITFAQKFQPKCDLIIFILDFVDFDQQINGELRVLKQSVSQFAQKNHLQVIPLEHVEELFFVIKNILETAKR